MYNKNLIFRVAMFTLILCLATTSLMGSTLARYSWSSGVVNAGTVSVAKFNFTVKDQGDTEYTTEGARIDIFGEENSSGKKELSPDDEGSFEIIVENTSEVTVEAIINARIVGTQDEEFVPNILFKYDENAEYEPLADMLTKLNASNTFKDIAFPAPNGFTQKSVTIYWKWIEGGNDDQLPPTMSIRMEVEATISQVD